MYKVNITISINLIGLKYHEKQKILFVIKLICLNWIILIVFFKTARSWITIQIIE